MDYWNDTTETELHIEYNKYEVSLPTPSPSPDEHIEYPSLQRHSAFKMYPSRGQTVEYRNPDELPVLYAVPAPRYPGLINIVNIPPTPPPFPAQSREDPNRQYLTVASDGSVIGVQHTLGYIDRDKARHCGSCTSDYDNLLRANHLPQYNHTCNMYPPLPPPPILPGMKDLYPNMAESPSLMTRPNSEIFSRCPPVRATELGTTMQHSTDNNKNVHIPPPILPPFTCNNSSTNSLQSSTPTAIPSTPSQYYSSTHQHWSLKHTSSRCMSQRMATAEQMEMRYHANKHVPMTPAERSVQVVSMKRYPPYKPDARQQIAAMLNARRQNAQQIRGLFNPCNGQSAHDRIDAALRASTERVEISKIALTTRHVNLPTKRVKRSRKSRPFRIQVVAPINSSEPLDLSESPTKTKEHTSEVQEQSKNFTTAATEKVQNSDEPLNLSETAAKKQREVRSNAKQSLHSPSSDVIKTDFAREMTSPKIVEQEFPPNIHRMTPVDSTEALDLSTRKCKKVKKDKKSDHLNSSTSSDSTSSDSSEEVLDLSLKSSTNPIDTVSFSASNTSDSNKEKASEESEYELNLPKIESVFTLTDAMKRSLLQGSHKACSVSLTDLNVIATSHSDTTLSTTTSETLLSSSHHIDLNGTVSRMASAEESARPSVSCVASKEEQRMDTNAATSVTSSPTDEHSTSVKPPIETESDTFHAEKEPLVLEEHQYCKSTTNTVLKVTESNPFEVVEENPTLTETNVNSETGTSLEEISSDKDHLNTESTTVVEHKNSTSKSTTTTTNTTGKESKSSERNKSTASEDTESNKNEDTLSKDSNRSKFNEGDDASMEPQVDESKTTSDIHTDKPEESSDVAVVKDSLVSSESVSNKNTHSEEVVDKTEVRKTNVHSPASRPRNPRRACKSVSFINREGECRHGCIGCNSVLKRFVAKPSKKSPKRKTNTDGNDGKGSSKVFLANDGSKLRVPVSKLKECQSLNYPAPQTQPMDLSQPSKKVQTEKIKKPAEHVFLKPKNKKNVLLVKMKTATPKKIRHLLQIEERKSKKIKPSVNGNDKKSKKIESMVKLNNAKPKNIRQIVKMKTGKPKKIKNLIKAENLVKAENKDPVKVENSVSLPNTELIKSVVLGGKAPILRLQKLTQQDVLDLSRTSTSHPKARDSHSKSSSEHSLEFTQTEEKMESESPCIKASTEEKVESKDSSVATEEKEESQEIEVERIVNGQIIGGACDSTSKDTKDQGQIVEEEVPNFERDLLQLTTGFDD